MNISVNIYQCFAELEANNCFGIIFRGEYQGLQNNRPKHKNADAIVRAHTHMYPLIISLHVHRLSINLLFYDNCRYSRALIG